jgi:hypothetical protein
VRRALLPLLVAAVAAPAAAQGVIGSLPDRSPYRDIEGRHTVTLFGGVIGAPDDRLDLAPRAAPVVGARYEFRMTGPAHAYARLAASPTERGTLTALADDSGFVRGADASVALTLVDVGLTLDLTGRKAWRSLVPYVSLGAGLATTWQSADPSGFDLGVPFMFTGGAGVRVLRGRTELRLDVSPQFYRVEYPGAFYDGAAPALPADAPRSGMRSSPVFSIGIARRWGR